MLKVVCRVDSVEIQVKNVTRLVTWCTVEILIKEV